MSIFFVDNNKHIEMILRAAKANAIDDSFAYDWEHSDFRSVGLFRKSQNSLRVPCVWPTHRSSPHVGSHARPMWRHDSSCPPAEIMRDMSFASVSLSMGEKLIPRVFEVLFGCEEHERVDGRDGGDSGCREAS